MAKALQSLFPWPALLSEESMHTFADEMDRLVWAAVDLGHFRALLAAFAGWESTAGARTL